MTYQLSIATAEDRALVVASLRAVSDQRARVARRASAEVMAEKRRDGKDIRSGAVKVTALLDEADRLEALAAQLEHAPEVVIVTPGQPTPAIVDAATGEPVDLTGDDGTSPEAQRLAELAGLIPADPDADPVEEDPVTYELPEDRPKPEDVVDVASAALGDPQAATT